MASKNPIMLTKEKKQQYEKIIDGDTPAWFKNAFSFLIDTVTEDLRSIDSKIEQVKCVKDQCDTNTTQIEGLMN